MGKEIVLNPDRNCGNCGRQLKDRGYKGFSVCMDAKPVCSLKNNLYLWQPMSFNPDFRNLTQKTIEVLDAAKIATLPEREGLVVKQRHRGVTMKNIAAGLGVSESLIQQIERAALAKYALCNNP